MAVLGHVQFSSFDLNSNEKIYFEKIPDLNLNNFEENFCSFKMKKEFIHLSTK